jgi:hypothetical protein
MNHVVRRWGPFVLVRTDEGFVWTVPVPGGDAWYWHPDRGHFTSRPCAVPTAERAARGLRPGARDVTAGLRQPAP